MLITIGYNKSAMSTHRVLGVEKLPRVRLFADESGKLIAAFYGNKIKQSHHMRENPQPYPHIPTGG